MVKGTATQVTLGVTSDVKMDIRERIVVSYLDGIRLSLSELGPLAGCCERDVVLNPLKPELNPICYLLVLLGAHHFLHVSRIRVKSLTFRLLMSYIYGAPILDVSRSHTTTQHSR